jgi:hypothetical protein
MFPEHLTAKWLLGHAGEAEHCAECSLAESFAAAREALIGHLHDYQLPIKTIFECSSSPPFSADIFLEKWDRKSPLILLWVYGNVFVRLRQVRSDVKSSMDDFYALATKLHEHIEAGAVDDKQQVTTVVATDLKGRCKVERSEIFNVAVHIDASNCYDDVVVENDVRLNPKLIASPHTPVANNVSLAEGDLPKLHRRR